MSAPPLLLVPRQLLLALLAHLPGQQTHSGDVLPEESLLFTRRERCLLIGALQRRAHPTPK
ncbi:hypothetical protein [Ktedonospora formicarum]|uniref:hypothetical protein n=1 Tax=Ktedonospora formicarum TaxID=2778364 RepID=UPI001C68AE3A|nr:hypothetical protein [Ktedonospora formicarum]